MGTGWAVWQLDSLLDAADGWPSLGSAGRTYRCRARAEQRFAGPGGALETRSMTRPDLCIDRRGNGSLNIPEEFLRISLIHAVMVTALNRRCAYKDRFSST